MPSRHTRARVHHMNMTPVATGLPLWWMSFVDPAKSAPLEEQQPGTGGFLGVAIIQAATLEDAMTISHTTGVNPGGRISIAGPMPEWTIAPEWRGRLLTADEANAIPDPTGGEL